MVEEELERTNEKKTFNEISGKKTVKAFRANIWLGTQEINPNMNSICSWSKTNFSPTILFNS